VKNILKIQFQNSTLLLNNIIIIIRYVQQQKNKLK